MRHTSSNSVTNLRFFPRIYVGGVLIHDGPAGEWRSVGHPTLVQPEGELDFEVRLILSREALESIEKARRGDVAIRIQGDVQYSIAHGGITDGHWVVGETRRMALVGGEGSGTWLIEVPQSDWVKKLNEIGWGLTDLVELTLDPVRGGIAARHLEKAGQHFLQGHWDEVLASAYRALEASVPKSFEGVASVSPNLSVDAQKALNDLAVKAKRFMHAGRHEDGSEPGRSDAHLALLVAAGILARFTDVDQLDREEEIRYASG